MEDSFLFYLPNIRSENSTAAGSMKSPEGAPRTALAAFWTFTYGVLHLMARRFNWGCWLQDWATPRWGDLGQVEGPGVPQGRLMDHKGLDPTRNWWLACKEKRKKQTEKKTGPRRGRLKRWSAAKWPWETLLSNGQLWHWRHEDSTLSTKPVSCLAWCNMGMLVVFFFLCCLQCSVSTLGLLRYCAALEFSSMNWSLQVRRGRKSWVSGGWWSMVKGSQSWLETDWRLTSGEKYWRELLLEVYVVLEGPNIGETYLRTVGQFGNMLFDLLVSLKFSLISRKGSFICFSESLQLEYFSDWWP